MKLTQESIWLLLFPLWVNLFSILVAFGIISNPKKQNYIEKYKWLQYSPLITKIVSIPLFILTVLYFSMRMDSGVYGIILLFVGIQMFFFPRVEDPWKDLKGAAVPYVGIGVFIGGVVSISKSWFF